jgi:murein DD-endopeptidase MepM/ murein hydrolase activator NlpD
MKSSHGKWYLILSIAILGGLTALLVAGSWPPLPENPADAGDLTTAGWLPEEEDAVTDEEESRRDIIEARILKGETASSLLGSYLSSLEIQQLAEQCRPIFPLSRLGACQQYRLHLEEENFARFEYDINAHEQLIICREEDGFEISRQPIAYEVQQELIRGSIRTNLFEAVAARDEQPELAIALADIFAWDIDFIRDVRQGDTFQVLFEKRFRDGQPAGYGKILAAEFINRGQTSQAFLYKNGSDTSYFDAEGRSIRKAFLKAPLSFTRISSGFSNRRFHPITQTWRAHPAIDYAAPPGTPIMTVGDGSITEIGYNKNNGNYIKIRHNNGYETIYLHMQKFAKGMQKNKRLAQGQVIGYVGSTGLATGPHLCFRMVKNGAPINPQTIKSPKAAPIPAERLAEFKLAISPYLAMLQREELEQVVAGN